MTAKNKDEGQSAAFIETAREIGADEQRSNADTLLGKLARTPPAPKPAKKPKSKKPGALAGL